MNDSLWKFETNDEHPLDTFLSELFLQYQDNPSSGPLKPTQRPEPACPAKSREPPKLNIQCSIKTQIHPLPTGKLHIHPHRFASNQVFPPVLRLRHNCNYASQRKARKGSTSRLGAVLKYAVEGTLPNDLSVCRVTDYMVRY